MFTDIKGNEITVEVALKLKGTMLMVMIMMLVGIAPYNKGVRKYKIFYNLKIIFYDKFLIILLNLLQVKPLISFIVI